MYKKSRNGKGNYVVNCIVHYTFGNQYYSHKFHCKIYNTCGPLCACNLLLYLHQIGIIYSRNYVVKYK